MFSESSGGARRFFGEFDRIYSFFASDDARFRARLAAATDAQVSFHPFRPGGDGHVSAGYLRSIGEDASPAEARLEPTSDDLAAAARVLAESKCDGSNLVVIFPGSGSPGKNWPARKFAALAAMLAKGSGILRSADSALNDTRAAQNDNGTSVAVILGPAEASIEPIFREAGVAVLKDLDLPTVAAIARIAAAFVGNDSGVSHLAAAVGASGVAIFGPTDPVRWRPLGSRPDRHSQARADRFHRGARSGRRVVEICGAASKIIDCKAVNRRTTSVRRARVKKGL